jgi:hypothetical protein
VEASKGNICKYRVVIVVAARVVTFLPEIFAESLFPRSDFAFSIGFRSYFVSRGDKSGSHAM